MNKITV